MVIFNHVIIYTGSRPLFYCLLAGILMSGTFTRCKMHIARH
uniref:Uncharacterized protein n=1 Tax=Rhizophora mucronata TaxID=61149 RepID=A0A2P2IHY9_RHIMU